MSILPDATAGADFADKRRNSLLELGKKIGTLEAQVEQLTADLAAANKRAALAESHVRALEAQLLTPRYTVTTLVQHLDNPELMKRANDDLAEKRSDRWDVLDISIFSTGSKTFTRIITLEQVVVTPPPTPDQPAATVAVEAQDPAPAPAAAPEPVPAPETPLSAGGEGQGVEGSLPITRKTITAAAMTIADADAPRPFPKASYSPCPFSPAPVVGTRRASSGRALSVEPPADSEAAFQAELGDALRKKAEEIVRTNPLINYQHRSFRQMMEARHDRPVL